MPSLRRVPIRSDFYRAGGRGIWKLVGASLFKSGISTYTFVDYTAGIFKPGWSPLAVYLANIAGLLVSSFIRTAGYRQMRVITFAEATRQRLRPAPSSAGPAQERTEPDPDSGFRNTFTPG